MGQPKLRKMELKERFAAISGFMDKAQAYITTGAEHQGKPSNNAITNNRTRFRSLVPAAVSIGLVGRQALTTDHKFTRDDVNRMFRGLPAKDATKEQKDGFLVSMINKAALELRAA